MRRRFSFVGAIATVATCFALSGVGAQNADNIGAPAKPVQPFPERNPDLGGGVPMILSSGFEEVCMVF